MYDGTQLTDRDVEAREQWAGWATAIARKRPWPAPIDILQTAVILGIREPGVALESDADAIRQARELKRRLSAAIGERDRLAAVAKTMAVAADRLADELRGLKGKHPRIWQSGSGGDDAK